MLVKLYRRRRDNHLLEPMESTQKPEVKFYLLNEKSERLTGTLKNGKQFNIRKKIKMIDVYKIEKV